MSNLLNPKYICTAPPVISVATRIPASNDQASDQWPESARAAPNGFLRSALFSATGRGGREQVQDVEIASVAGIQIKFTGQRFDQGDMNLFMSIVLLANKQGWTEINVNTATLLKMTGKKDTGGNRATLEARMGRLVAGTVTISNAWFKYFGHLLSAAGRDAVTGHWVIQPDRRLVPLFKEGHFTFVDWRVRRCLEGKPLAQWLHAFFSSHAEPFPYRQDTLLRLAGSTASEARSGNQTLRRALAAVAGACAEHGQIFRFELVDGLVNVSKTPSRSQKRHLGRKK